jgi:hypothetical protein
MRKWLLLITLALTALVRGQTASQPIFFRNHCLFVHNGYLKTESASPKQILSEYLKKGHNEPIVIHFHGGLVSEASAKKEALDLNASCYGDRSYPIFLAWNADLFTEIGNLLESRYHNAAFAQGRISTAQFLAGIYDNARQNGYSLDDLSGSAQKLMDAYRQYMSQSKPFQKAVSQQAQQDDDILGSGQSWADWTDLETWKKAKERLEHRVTNYFSPYVKGFTKYHDANSVSWGGDLLEWVCYNLGGRSIWSRMKSDTAYSFTSRNGVPGAGLQLLLALHDLPRLPRIILIGHSTGCIYIANFLRAARTMLPGARFDVVFLAPANTYQEAAEVLVPCQDEIVNFRMFGIREDAERRDHMLWQLNPNLGGIYPGSLLIFVSRAVEAKRNMALLGLQHNFAVPAMEPDHARCLAVHRALLDRPGAVVWSPSTGPPGLCSNCTSHGDFCSDPRTLLSLRHLIDSTVW